MSNQNYPNANVWQRVEVGIEPEPALVAVRSNLSLPVAWPEERRAAWLIRLDTAPSAS